MGRPAGWCLSHVCLRVRGCLGRSLPRHSAGALPGRRLNAAPPPGDSPRGRPQRGYSLAPTETELRAAHGNTGSCVPSDRPASTPNAARSALGHGLRDAFATELANSEGQCLHADDPARAGIEGETDPRFDLPAQRTVARGRRTVIPHRRWHQDAQVRESMWMEPDLAL